jgi:hypothetical protein
MFEINSLGCMYKWIQIDMILGSTVYPLLPITLCWNEIIFIAFVSMKIIVYTFLKAC